MVPCPGLFQFALGVLRLGLVVNFLSHPVVNGFINAAAVISITTQLPTLFGIDVEKTDNFLETVLIFLCGTPPVSALKIEPNLDQARRTKAGVGIRFQRGTALPAVHRFTH